MKLYRIYAIILRYLYLFRKSFDKLSDAFYWPTIDLLIWGLTSAYLQTFSHNSQILILILSGLIFWYIIWRSQYEITVNILEELWDKNLINLFVAPLKFAEWITSFLVLGIIKAMLSLSFMAILAFFLYKIQILTYGYFLIPFVAMLLMTGWWVGLFVAGIILRYGTRIQTLAWSVVAIISPFSAVYYPVSVLPKWAQYLATILPSSYVFEGMREVIKQHTLDPQKIVIAFILNAFYLILASIYLKRSFQKRLEHGLVNLD